MKYYLMNKDDKLLTFETIHRLGDVLVVEKERHAKRMPIGFTDISLWIENRNYAKHKDSLKAYLKEWGIDNVDGFIDITHCLGLNDTLWVKNIDSSLRWDEVSLYTNEFSDVCEKTAFGNGLQGIEISSTDLTSPEFVSPGSFAKCWKREEDGIYLYKTTGTLSQGLEPFCEYFASQIASQVDVETVKYELTKLNGKLCTKCKMFTSEDIGLVSFAGVFDITKKRYNIPAIIDECEQLGFGEEIRKMYMIDSLILNQDRHLGNIGFLFDNNTFEITGFAPIYDFNLSMLGNVYPEDMLTIDTIDRYIETNNIGPKSSDASFYDIAIGIGIDVISKVSFKQNNLYKMDAERFKILSEYIKVNHKRIVHHNPELNRQKSHKVKSLIDYMDGLKIYKENETFYVEITKDDFMTNKYLLNYSSLYGLSDDEIIIVSVDKNGRIECSIRDELGESEAGDELLGDKEYFYNNFLKKFYK